MSAVFSRYFIPTVEIKLPSVQGRNKEDGRL